jgi:hypothetical protein
MLEYERAARKVEAATWLQKAWRGHSTRVQYWQCLERELSEIETGVSPGLGRIVALHYRSSASYQIH